MLSSAPRWLLRYNSRALRGFDQTARDQLSTPNIDAEHRQTLQSLRAILDASPLKLSVFERILSDIDATIRNTQRKLSIFRIEAFMATYMSNHITIIHNCII